jgi:hypothetical protein
MLRRIARRPGWDEATLKRVASPKFGAPYARCFRQLVGKPETAWASTPDLPPTALQHKRIIDMKNDEDPLVADQLQDIRTRLADSDITEDELTTMQQKINVLNTWPFREIGNGDHHDHLDSTGSDHVHHDG